jgi:hypothetical protein
MKMEIYVNGVRVPFYFETKSEVNIVSKETFDYIYAPSIQ